MSQGCAGGGDSAFGDFGGGSGSEFRLPDEILAVMPTDPCEQLDLARKITSMAIASRASKLDLETGRLRRSVAEKDRAISELQEKVSQLDSMLQDADSKLRAALEENIKLVNERDSLVQRSKKLSRDLAKLETFKRQLMLSLNEDNSPKQQDVLDVKAGHQLVAQSSSCKDDVSMGRRASYPLKTSTEMANTKENDQPVTRLAGKRSAITSMLPPRFTPITTPKITSTVATPKGISTTVSPKLTSGATSPTKSLYEGITSMSPWLPSSKQSSAAGSPRGCSISGSSPRVDGKEFFRQARSRLSYEQFGAFLANIKELNAHRQSREETLRKAEEIFGADNKGLYLSFQGLLNRNMR